MHQYFAMNSIQFVYNIFTSYRYIMVFVEILVDIRAIY